MLVDLWFNWGALDDLKAISAEEICLKCQTETSGNADLIGSLDNIRDDGITHTFSTHLLHDSDGANLGEILPENV